LGKVTKKQRNKETKKQGSKGLGGFPIRKKLRTLAS